MTKKTYKIGLNGCDDSTWITIDLTSEELALVEKLVGLSEEASTYGCQPTMNVEELSTPNK